MNGEWVDDSDCEYAICDIDGDVWAVNESDGVVNDLQNDSILELGLELSYEGLGLKGLPTPS